MYMSYYNTVVLQKAIGPTMDYPPTSLFGLDFLLRSKTYSKRDFPLSSKPEDAVHTHLVQGANYTGAHAVIYTSTMCLAHDVTHRLVVHNIIAQMSAHPPF